MRRVRRSGTIEVRVRTLGALLLLTLPIGAMAVDPVPAIAPDPQTAEKSVSDSVGTLQGSFRVDEQGAATYTAPIEVPRGSGGVAPDLALRYSSAAGNGIIGQGWSIAGLSAITRCRQTLYQDGVAKPISWDENDRFCLDGQRLVLEAPQTVYGATGATYRTEIESYVRVTAIGGSLGKPNYFKAEGKDGVTRIFGASTAPASTDSEQGARNSSGAETSNVLMWAISKLTDSAGNRIEYSYEDDTAGHRISQIRYGYGVGAPYDSSPGATVDFIYDVTARPDPMSGYVAGYLFSTMKRLQRIDVKGMKWEKGQAETQLAEVRSYVLTYASAGTPPRSRLWKIKECSSSAATVCYPDTAFTWTVPTLGYSSTLAVNGSNTFPTEGVPALSKPADVNGDGKADLVWIHATADDQLEPELRWARSDGTTLVPQTTLLAKMPSHENYQFTFHVLDFNNDGYSDLLHPDHDQGQWVVHLAKDTNGAAVDGWALTTTPDVFTGIPLGGADTSMAADLNADGLTDLIYEKSTGQYAARLLQWVPDGCTNGFSAEIGLTFGALPADPTYPTVAQRVVTLKSSSVVDFDGDGMADVATITDRDLQTGPGQITTERFLAVYRQSALGQFEHYFSHKLGAMPDWKTVNFVPGDINGDGLTDFLFGSSPTASWTVRINKGTGFANVQDVGNLTGDQLVQLSDYNRDGFPDIVYPPASSGVLQVRLYDSVTGTFAAGSATNIGYTNEQEEIYHFIDVNGDGHAESVRLTGSNGASLQIRHPNGFQSPAFGATTANYKIGSITDGLGAVTTLTYGSLNQPAVHVAEHAACGVWPVLLWAQTLGKDKPVIEVMPSLFVVTNVARSSPTAGVTAGLENVNVNPASAVHLTDYVYTSAKVQGAGRGFLGFRKIAAKDRQTGLWTTTSYRQDFPFIGRPEVTEIATDARTLSTIRTWWSLQDLAGHPGAPFRVYSYHTVDNAYDLTDGTLLNSSYHRIVSQDFYGNATEIEQARCDPSDIWCLGPLSKINTVNEYGTSPTDTAGQEKGRLKKSTATYRRPNETDVVRETTYTYYTSTAANNLLWTETRVGDADTTRTTTHEYDSYGNRTKSTISGRASKGASTNQQRYTRWVYDPRGRFANETFVRTDNVGLTTAPPGGTAGELLIEEVLERNALGQPTQVKSDNAVTTWISYGALGREYERYRDTGETTTTFLYTGAGTECPATPSGLTKFYTKTRANYQGSAGAQTYDSVADAQSDTTITCHDVLGRVIREATVGFAANSWIYADSTYDNAGRVRHRSQPYYKGSGSIPWNIQSYDALGRVTQLIDAKNGAAKPTTTIYDDLTVTIIDPLGHKRQQLRDYRGELVRVTDHNALEGRTTGSYTEYRYNAAGNLRETAVKTPGSNIASGLPAGTSIVTTIEYDAWGRKTKLIDPDKGTWEYTYNAFDELIVQCDAKRQKSVLQYDGLGRRTVRDDYRTAASCSATGSRESATLWVFDQNPYFAAVVPGRALGAVHSLYDENEVQSGSVLQILKYGDSANDPINLALKRNTASSVTLDGQSTPFTETQTFDSYGRIFQRFDASNRANEGRGIQYVYNARGYKEKTLEASNTALAYSTVVDMDAYGNVKEESLGNGLKTWRGFETQRGLPLTVRTADAANLNDTQDLTLTWDEVGNLKTRQDKGLSRNWTESFDYDELNRLTHTLRGSTNVYMDYDAFGNLKRKSDQAETYVYGTSRPHAVHTLKDASGGTLNSLTYDANGNLDEDSTRDLTNTTFDKPERITRGTDATTFRYGPDRQYYMREDAEPSISPTAKTTTWFVGSAELVVKSDNTRVVRRYIDGVAQVILQADANWNVLSTMNTRYFERDHLGSIVGFLTDTATVDVQLSFDAWGLRRNVSGSAMTVGSTSWNKIAALTNRGFTGHEHVDKLDLIHMNGRTFDPRIGRFMQADVLVQDPADTQSYNRYSYGNNNPLNGTDLSGYDFGLLELVIWVAVEYVAYKETGTIVIPFGDFAIVVPIGNGGSGGLTGAASGAFGSQAGRGGSSGSSVQHFGSTLGNYNAREARAHSLAVHGYPTSDWYKHLMQEATVSDTDTVVSDGKSANGAVSESWGWVVDIGLEVVPGGELIRCSMGGCSGTDWAWAVLDVTPVGKIAKIRKVERAIERLEELAEPLCTIATAGHVLHMKGTGGCSSGAGKRGTSYHGNDRRNPDPQHNYDIIGSDGRVRKTGVGTGLADDGVSKRAASQLDPGDYYVIRDRHPGGLGARGRAYDREKELAKEHYAAGESMDKHKRPR